jgi:hypothetical protein
MKWGRNRPESAKVTLGGRGERKIEWRMIPRRKAPTPRGPDENDVGLAIFDLGAGVSEFPVNSFFVVTGQPLHQE